MGDTRSSLPGVAQSLALSEPCIALLIRDNGTPVPTLDRFWRQVQDWVGAQYPPGGRENVWTARNRTGNGSLKDWLCLLHNHCGNSELDNSRAVQKNGIFIPGSIYLKVQAGGFINHNTIRIDYTSG